MDKNRMLVHCGGINVEMPQLHDYQIPELTSTYTPISHYDLADFIKTTASDLLRSPLCREAYAITKDGARMFGLQVFGDDSHKCQHCHATGSVLALNMETMEEAAAPCPACNGTGWEPDEYGFGVAFRNSYDKSMSVGISAGFNVFICDNMCISGEIKILRKHTKGVWQDIDQTLVHTLFRKGPEIREQFAEDVHFFKSHEMPVHEGYRLLGFLMGNKVLMPTQASVAFDQWNNVVDHKAIMANAWQFYNATTVALKSTPPHRVLEAHRAAHEMIKLELQ